MRIQNNVQVATAGEDEEDLRVVDGQQRTARRDEKHGYALNTTCFALSLFLGGEGEEKNDCEEICPYMWIQRSVRSSPEGAEALCGSSEPAVRVRQTRRCISRPMGALDTWPERGLGRVMVGGRKRGNGGRAGEGGGGWGRGGHVAPSPDALWSGLQK